MRLQICSTQNLLTQFTVQHTTYVETNKSPQEPTIAFNGYKGGVTEDE